jgi:hypothetical protein
MLSMSDSIPSHSIFMLSPQSPETETSLPLETSAQKKPTQVARAEQAEISFPISSGDPVFGHEEEEYFSFEI